MQRRGRGLDISSTCIAAGRAAAHAPRYGRSTPLCLDRSKLCANLKESRPCLITLGQKHGPLKESTATADDRLSWF